MFSLDLARAPQCSRWPRCRRIEDLTGPDLPRSQPILTRHPHSRSPRALFWLEYEQAQPEDHYLDLLIDHSRQHWVIIKTKFETVVVLRVAKIYTIGITKARVEYSTSKSDLLLRLDEDATEDAGIALKGSRHYT
jgi:hypothetical protein